MRSHVFLTPMTPDGKPGEVKEIQLTDPGAQMFAAVVPYFATHDAPASSAEVQKQIDALIAELPKLRGGARSKADHQLRLLERELRRALDLEESERRKSERRNSERQRQQPGINQRQSLEQAVASAVAGVAALTSKQVKNKLTWNTLLRDLDARVPTTTSTQQATRCCAGRYLCAKCQARKPAAGA